MLQKNVKKSELVDDLLDGYALSRVSFQALGNDVFSLLANFRFSWE